MRNALCFILFFCLYASVQGQSRFNRIYRMFTRDSTGQQSATTFRSLRIVNNNIYTAGVAVRIIDSVITNSGIFSSFDMSGNLIKNTYFGVIPTNSDFNDDLILVEPNNQFSLAGNNFEGSFTFSKVDKDGNTLFKKKYISTDTTYYLGIPTSLTKIEDKYAFTLRASYPQFTKALVYIIDSLGNTKRLVEFYEGEKNARATQVIKNKNNNLIISLYHTSKNTADSDYVYVSQLCEIDTLGNKKWTYSSPRNKYIYIKKFVQLANGNYLVWGDEELSKIVVGSYYSTRNVYDVGPYLAEINPQRGLVWEKRFNLGTASRMYGFKMLKDSSMILSCSYDYGPNNSNACIIKLNKNRDSSYRRNFRATSITTDRVLPLIYQIEELDNGDLVLGGYAQDFYQLSLSPTSGQWGWIVRTDSLGCSLEPSSCRVPTQEVNDLPLSMAAYPNPTSGSLTIDFDSQKPFNTAFLSMMDIAGREVLKQKIDAGQKQIVWQTEGIQNGLYFIVLTLDNQITHQTKVSVQK
jgi:Secretion system C-terminal sorting domain